MDCIIPKRDFNVPYSKVLNDIDCVITLTERKMLLLFERYCYLDGLIYPKQSTIASKLNISVRQVIRVLQSLEKKNFILINKVNLKDRHLYGKRNSYALTNNSFYNKKFFVDQMSHEKECNMSHENKDISLYNNKSIKDIKHVCPYFDVEKFLNENQKDNSEKIINALNSLVNRLPDTCNFNIPNFLYKHKTKHPMAIIDALNAISENIKYPMAYASKIVDIKSGNYNAIDYDRKILKEKDEYHNAYIKIANGLGFNYTGERTNENINLDDVINTKRNEQQRKLFEMFPVN